MSGTWQCGDCGEVNPGDQLDCVCPRGYRDDAARRELDSEYRQRMEKVEADMLANIASGDHMSSCGYAACDCGVASAEATRAAAVVEIGYAMWNDHRRTCESCDLCRRFRAVLAALDGGS